MSIRFADRVLDDVQSTCAIPSAFQIYNFAETEKKVKFGIPVTNLPLGSMLCLLLRGLKNKNSDPKKSHIIGWANVPLFDHFYLLKKDLEFISFWVEQNPEPGSFFT